MRVRSRPRPPVVKTFEDWIRTHRCAVTGESGVEAHHVHGIRSTKTGERMRRRQHLARYAVIPVCKHHHQDSRHAIQTVGDEAFGVHHLGGRTAVLDWALTLALRYISEGRS